MRQQMLKNIMIISLISGIVWVLVSCAPEQPNSPLPTPTMLAHSPLKPSPTFSPTPSPTPTPKPTRTRRPTATKTPSPTVTPTERPLPSPPPTVPPKQITLEVVGVLSSMPDIVRDSGKYVHPYDTSAHYSYIVVTMYITTVIRGEAHISSGDTIILHDGIYSPMAPGAEPRLLFVDMETPPQEGFVYHLVGPYHINSGVMEPISATAKISETAIYTPPPIVGQPGDIVPIIVKYKALDADKLSGARIVGEPEPRPIVRIIDENWAEVITGTVHLGEVLNSALFDVEVVKPVPQP